MEIFLISINEAQEIEKYKFLEDDSVDIFLKL